MRAAAVVLVDVVTALSLAAFSGCSQGGSPAGDAGRAPPPKTRQLTVAAAADLKFALEDVVAGFRRRHPEIRVDVSYGSSGKFFAQLQNRAPFDLFLSADMDFPRRLVDAGLAPRKALFRYAVGHLVVWVPRDSKLEVERRGLGVLLDPSVRKIALANPRFAPYGRAAEAALRHTGLYDQVKDRLVLGENVAQAAVFVRVGAADVGLIARSQALAPQMHDKGRFKEVPPEDYPRLEQGGVVLSWAKDPDAAAALRTFLTGPGGRAILRRYGFSVPED